MRFRGVLLLISAWCIVSVYGVAERFQASAIISQPIPAAAGPMMMTSPQVGFMRSPSSFYPSSVSLPSPASSFEVAQPGFLAPVASSLPLASSSLPFTSTFTSMKPVETILSSSSAPSAVTASILSRLESKPLSLPTAMLQNPSLSSKTAKLVAENTPSQPQAIVQPFTLPILPSELPLDTKWDFVTQPITTKPRTLNTVELSPITQHYTVASTTFQRENIKQPITEPVFQPYLQRYIQQAHPEVQPIVQRVVQPVVHRELHSFLQTRTEQAPDADTLIKPTQTLLNTNQAIRGADMAPLPISKTVSNA